LQYFFSSVSIFLPGEFFDKYAVLVALNNVGYMEHPCNSNKKKVRIFYGPAKEGWAYGLGNAFFDLILCPGYYSQEKLTKFYSAKVVPVGEPKLDALYQNGFLSEEAKEIDLALDKNKKTILYMPTWGALSSSKIVVPSLLKLLPNYNIIVKIHHITNMFSPEEMKYLDNNRFIIIKELVPVTDALKLADVVISDSSSSIFGAMVAGKGLVLIDTIKGDEKFFTEASFLAHKRIKI
jgi:UDP-N-acetylglucosamine 2-epimerase